MESIKDLLEKFISKNKLDRADDGDVIREKWEEIAGEFSRTTKPFKYAGKKLFIYAENSVIMSEIIYKKRELKDKINAFFGRETVREIIARMRQ
ncbi:MAG: DUF721 domain-containing protein [Candidatus Goldiibacteriota bacterium]|jgi:hypothetical protein